MESIAKYVSLFKGLAPALETTEWVGFAVLVCVVTAAWTSLRGSKPEWNGPSARVFGLSSLATILFGIWFGITTHLLIGAVILAVGCCLSFWSLLLRFGVSWRQHLRPGLTPALIVVVFLIALWFAPRIAAISLVVIGLWARRIVRIAVQSVDRQLNGLSIRALALTNHEAASYLTNAWFQRFAPHASNLTLLALAFEARARTNSLPRARRIVQASDALDRLATSAEDAVDQRLRTDGATWRTSSWVRVLTVEFFRQIFRRSGMVAIFRFISDLLLAVPRKPEESWSALTRNEGLLAPDPQGYVVALIADLPAAVHPADLDALRDRITRDADLAGRGWLSLIATRAECLREETPNPDRDLRMEIVAEVLWGVYETAIGPRPARYDVYDQVRLQTPELVQRSSVRDVRVQDNVLVMHLDVMPRTFDELGSGSPVLVHTPDGITWSFRILETTETGVMLLFAPQGTVRVPGRPELTERPIAPKRSKEIATALAAAASQ